MVRDAYKARTVTDARGNVWPRCCGDSFDGWSYQCGRAGKIEDEQDPTLHWCWQHDPVKERKKQDAQAAKWDAERRARDELQERLQGWANRAKACGINLDVRYRFYGNSAAYTYDLVVPESQAEKLVKLLEGMRHEAPLEEMPSFDDVEAAGADGTLREDRKSVV